MAVDLKTIYSWLHLWLGLAVGLIFTVASATGVILVFEDELEPLLYPKLYTNNANTTGNNLPLDQLVSMAQNYAGKNNISNLTINGKSYLFRTEGNRLDRYFLRLDPHTGALQQKLKGSSHLFSVAEETHRRLLMDSLGKTITGISCISYLVILVTGLILWWPKNKKVLKQRLKIKWDAKAKRLNWDIHAVGGFYTLPVIFIICLTGLTWSFKWFNNGIFLLFDGKKQQNTEIINNESSTLKTDLPIQKAYNTALSMLKYPGTTSIALPHNNDEQKVLEISRTNENAAIPNVVDRLFFDHKSGAFLKADYYDQQTKGMKVRRFVYPLHVGSFGGIFTKTLYLFVVILASSMPITGLFVWLGRKKKKKPTR